MGFEVPQAPWAQLPDDGCTSSHQGGPKKHPYATVRRPEQTRLVWAIFFQLKAVSLLAPTLPSWMKALRERLRAAMIIVQTNTKASKQCEDGCKPNKHTNDAAEGRHNSGIMRNQMSNRVKLASRTTSMYQKVSKVPVTARDLKLVLPEGGRTANFPSPTSMGAHSTPVLWATPQ